MKLLRQFLIILAISFVGEALKYLLPLPVPASIYGMVILFVGLLTGLIKLSWVKDAGKYLIAVMPVMFMGGIKTYARAGACCYGCCYNYGYGGYRSGFPDNHTC
mgnify:CR=1 FL=1